MSRGIADPPDAAALLCLPAIFLAVFALKKMLSA